MSKSISAIAAVAALVFACAGDDAGPIEFSNLRIEELTATRAVLRFDTSVPAACELEYGLTMTQLDLRARDPDMAPGEMALDHEVPLEDLVPETTYHLRARATDASGTTTYSDTMQLTTPSGDDPTAGLTNVALLEHGTTVVEVSSNWGGGDNDSGYGIHKALDGMLATEWSSNGDGDSAYVVLDLGQDRVISHIGYRSRWMADGTSIVKTVRVLVDDGAAVLGPYDTPDHETRYVFTLPEPITARTVRVEAVDTTGGNTGAKEIQLFSP